MSVKTHAPETCVSTNFTTSAACGSQIGIAKVAVCVVFDNIYAQKIMPNIIVIGDLHGRAVWKTVDPTRYDHVVFVGDYTDSFSLSDETIFTNLLQIIVLKQTYPNKVTLLLGNHDIQYLYYPDNRCSGFRPSMQPDLTRLFRQHKALFQIAWQYDNYLVTHAGLTKRWWTWIQTKSSRVSNWATLPIAEQLNRIHQSPDRWLLFTVGPSRGGFHISGPLWADGQDTIIDPLPNHHQIVGHTPQVGIYINSRNADTSVTYIDVTDRLGATFYEQVL